MIALAALVACVGGTVQQAQAMQQVLCAQDTPATEGEQQAVVAAARDFAASLDAGQHRTLQLAFTRDNAVRWSNLPITVPRVGVRFGDLNHRQIDVALTLVSRATSVCGRKMFDDIRAADHYISGIIERFHWSSDNYFIAYLGEPSMSKPWMLKIGGHHIAYNFTYNSRLPGATPLFDGTEPIKFEAADGVHEPLAAQSRAMSALAQGLVGYPRALLPGTFTDVVKGVEVTLVPEKPPIGGNDTAFPSAYPTGTDGRGIKYSQLKPAQQKLVRDAMATYAALPGAPLTKPLMAAYLAPEALAETFVGYAQSPQLDANGSYVRIDGPRAWMELVVQPGVAYPEKQHFHALWRDKIADYGGEFGK